MSKLFGPVLGFACLCASFSINALNISDLDLTALSFEIDSFADNPMIPGTSNGIPFEFLAASPVFVPFSNLIGSQDYGLPNTFDDMHAGSSFTITFAEPISKLLVALANDNITGDGPDFGLIPADSSGITIGGASGTRLGISETTGALALFEFATPVSVVTHTNDAVNDGWDLSFFAYPVPIPPSIVLFAPALWALSRRRRSGPLRQSASSAGL